MVVLFQDAAPLILAGQPMQRKHRKGGRVIVKSKAQAYAKLGPEDFYAEDWEPYNGIEPMSSTWLP